MPFRIAAFAALGLAYVLASHWLMTSAPPSPWNAVGLLTPMLAATALGTWQAGQRGRSLATFALIAGLVALAAEHVEMPAPLLYLGQHVVINLSLGLWFAGTLREGAEPLISTMAARVHGPLTPTMAVYTRQVTCAWVAYFFSMSAISLVLFALAPFEQWAFFANLLTPLAVGLMFGGERLLRYRLHPEFHRSTVADAIRAYMHTSAVARERPHDPLA